MKKLVLILVAFVAPYYGAAFASENPQAEEIERIAPDVRNETAQVIVNFLQLPSTEVSLQSPDEGKTLIYRAFLPNQVSGMFVEAILVHDVWSKTTGTQILLSSQKGGHINFITPNVRVDDMTVSNKLKTLRDIDTLHYEARAEMIWARVLEMHVLEEESHRWIYNTEGIQVGTAVVTKKFRSLVYHNHHLRTKKFLSRSTRQSW